MAMERWHRGRRRAQRLRGRRVRGRRRACQYVQASTCARVCQCACERARASTCANQRASMRASEVSGLCASECGWARVCACRGGSEGVGCCERGMGASDASRAGESSPSLFSLRLSSRCLPLTRPSLSPFSLFAFARLDRVRAWTVPTHYIHHHKMMINGVKFSSSLMNSRWLSFFDHNRFLILSQKNGG